jgi:sugar phosphate isomerase/epimerase
MPKLSISQVTTYNWSFGEDIASYAAANIAGIGVFRDKMDRFGMEEGIAALRASPLGVSNLVDTSFLIQPAWAQVELMIQDVLARIELAQRINTDCVVVLTGEPAGFFMSEDIAWQFAIQAMKEAAPAAEAAGIKLALEPISARYPGFSFLHSIPDALRIIDAVGSLNLGIIFDCDHLYESPDLFADIQRAAGRIFCVHLDDIPAEPEPGLDRRPLGTGIIPLKEIVHAIDATGYDGYYDVELFGANVWGMDYQQLLNQTKEAFARLWEG